MLLNNCGPSIAVRAKFAQLSKILQSFLRFLQIQRSWQSRRLSPTRRGGTYEESSSTSTPDILSRAIVHYDHSHDYAKLSHRHYRQGRPIRTLGGELDRQHRLWSGRYASYLYSQYERNGYGHSHNPWTVWRLHAARANLHSQLTQLQREWHCKFVLRRRLRLEFQHTGRCRPFDVQLGGRVVGEPWQFPSGYSRPPVIHFGR